MSGSLSAQLVAVRNPLDENWGVDIRTSDTLSTSQHSLACSAGDPGKLDLNVLRSLYATGKLAQLMLLY